MIRTELLIQRAFISDLEALQQLFVETIRSICTSDYSAEQICVWTASVENKKRWEHKIFTQYFLKATIDQKIVGFASLENGEYIDMMYVHKDYQKQGIADQLLISLTQETLRLGMNFMYANVSKTARPFFEKKGFQVAHENKLMINGVAITNFRMTKYIN